MTSARISLSSVNLHYATANSVNRSLKSLLTHAFNREKVTSNIRDIHALKNISVEIGAGERVGLLGHNGAGKTTFLKAVAGLYPLSSGSLQVQGEVRSLFDLSLGFEPDATGRQNILYRGLLLGLSPAYMRQLESDIVEFAGLGDFIDYPVKTYSAGMQVRLAFAISTSVGGELLLLDEVLGAGDANFMLKAAKRIDELINQADILILASHDLGSLERLCERGLVFHHGELIFDGTMSQSINAYHRANQVP